MAVDGVCLTVTECHNGILAFDLMKETLEKTTLKSFAPGCRVNLERALKLSDRLGGHFLTGHVDAIGILRAKIILKNYVELRIGLKERLMRYIVPKGSIAVDGVSLTVGENPRGKTFSVYLIPYTLKATTLGQKGISDQVNIETDILAKYALISKY